MRTAARWISTVVLLAGTFVLARPVWAQQAGLGSQSLRGYWHVFIAYALAWIFVLGWLVSVFRRLGRLDQDVGKE